MLLSYDVEMDEQGVIRLGDLIDSPKRGRVRVILLESTVDDNEAWIELLAEAEQSMTEQTLGDLLVYGFGLWSHRDDIDDSVAYAQQLRRESWARNTL